MLSLGELVLNVKAKLDPSSVKEATDEAVKKSEKELSDAKKTLSSAGTSMAKGIAKSVAGIGTAVAGAFVGVKKFTDQYAEQFDEIAKGSQKLQMSSEAYQRWSHALSISGSDISALTPIMKKLGDNIDKNKESVSQLGLSYEELSALSPEDQFNAIVHGLAAMEDEQQRNALAADLLGKNYTELLPLLNSGVEEIDNLMGEAVVISDDALKAGEEYGDTMERMRDQIQSVGAELGSAVLPVVVDLAKEMLPMVKEGVAKLKDKIKDIDFKKVAANIKDTVVKIKDFIVENKNTIATVAKVAAGITAAIAVISKVITIVKTVTTVVKALFVVLSANPVGLIIAAITAVIAILVTLYNKCEPFKEFVDNMWEAIKNFFAAIPGVLKEAFDNVVGWFKDIGAKVKNFGKDVKSKFTDTMNNVKSAAKTGWENTKKSFQTGIDNCKNAITNAKDKFKEAATSVADKVKAGMDTLNDVKKGLAANMGKTLENVTKKFKAGDIIGGLKEAVTGWFGNITTVLDVLESKGGIVGKIAGFINGAIDKFKNGYSEIKSAVQTWFAGIQDAINEKIENLKKKWSEFWDNLKPGKKDNDNSGGTTKANKSTTAGKFATGLSYVPYDNYAAILHRGERVMTRTENTDYTKNGGSTSSSPNITYNNTFNIPDNANPMDTARAILKAQRRDKRNAVYLRA